MAIIVKSPDRVSIDDRPETNLVVAFRTLPRDGSRDEELLEHLRAWAAAHEDTYAVQHGKMLAKFEERLGHQVTSLREIVAIRDQQVAAHLAALEQASQKIASLEQGLIRADAQRVKLERVINSQFLMIEAQRSLDPDAAALAEIEAQRALVELEEARLAARRAQLDASEARLVAKVEGQLANPQA